MNILTLERMKMETGCKAVSIPEDRASDALQNLLDHNSSKFGRGFLLGDKVCVAANFLWSY